MRGIVRSEKDFWAGLLYLGIGTATLYIALDYNMGNAVRMGPGYFPRVLGGILVVLGMVAIIRSIVKPGEPLGDIAWKSAGLVSGAMAMFGMLLVPAGLLFALLALILASASASVAFGWRVRPLLAMLGLIGFCAALFVGGLHLPMPLFGTWFGG